jgi:hypothetical protein
MAIQIKGILSPGGISGKIGNLVYYTWRGKPCVRTVPRKRFKKVSRAQIIHRKRFGLVTQTLRVFMPVLNLGFRDPRDRTTPLNRAVSYALKNTVKGQYPNFGIDYANMLFSRGRLCPAYNPVVENMAGESLRFTWEYRRRGGEQGDDTAILIAVCEDPLPCFFMATNAVKAGGIGFLHTPGMAGKKMHTYIGFIDAKEKHAADSVYTGELMITP